MCQNVGKISLPSGSWCLSRFLRFLALVGSCGSVCGQFRFRVRSGRVPYLSHEAVAWTQSQIPSTFNHQMATVIFNLKKERLLNLQSSFYNFLWFWNSLYIGNIWIGNIHTWKLCIQFRNNIPVGSWLFNILSWIDKLIYVHFWGLWQVDFELQNIKISAILMPLALDSH